MSLDNPIDDAPESSKALVVPMFPLPSVCLFPGTAMPLRIFEPRYCEMIQDMLDGPGRLVLGTVPEEHVRAIAGSPPVYPVAGLGEIGQHERVENGRFNIVLVGLSRVRIEEIPSDKAYRLVRIEELEESTPSEDEDAELKPRLREAIHERSRGLLPLPDSVPAGRLADYLTLQLKLPESDLLELFSSNDVVARGNKALELHKSQPIKDTDEDEPTIPDFL